MKIASLRDLLVDELRDCYSMEKQILKALPKVIKNCTSDELRTGLEEHLEETKGQVERIEQCFEHLDLKPKAKKCAGMEGILEEGDEMIGEIEEESVVDACIIGGCQKVEHYEIASYGTMCAWCEQLGLEEMAALLKQSLDEEKAADEKLTQLAESMANAEAAQPDEEEEEEEKMAHAGKSNGRRRR